jgi:hypothetical protein
MNGSITLKANDELPFDRGIKHGLVMYMKRLRFYLCWAAMGFLLCVLVGSGVVHAGFPAHCEKPVCGMKQCTAIKNGKANGSNCQNRCSKTCCLCTKACPHDEYRGDPEQEQ